MFMGILSACMCVYHMSAWYPREPKSDWSYRQLWADMWVMELNSGPLEELLMLSTSEPSLWSHHLNNNDSNKSHNNQQ